MKEKQTIQVCLGPACLRQGTDLLTHRLLGLLAEEGWQDLFEVKGSCCQSICDQGPVVSIGKETLTGPAATSKEALKKAMKHSLANDQ